jgi:hypothetical protein
MPTKRRAAAAAREFTSLPVPIEPVCLPAVNQNRRGRWFRANAAMVSGVAALALGSGGCGSASESASRPNTVPLIPHAVVPVAPKPAVHRAPRARRHAGTTTAARLVSASTVAGSAHSEPRTTTRTRTAGAPPPESGGDANSKTISTPGTATTTPNSTSPVEPHGVATTEAPAVSVPAAGG